MSAILDILYNFRAFGQGGVNGIILSAGKNRFKICIDNRTEDSINRLSGNNQTNQFRKFEIRQFGLSYRMAKVVKCS